MTSNRAAILTPSPIRSPSLSSPHYIGADAKLDAPIGRQAGIELDHAVLYLDPRLGRKAVQVWGLGFAQYDQSATFARPAVHKLKGQPGMGRPCRRWRTGSKRSASLSTPAHFGERHRRLGPSLSYRSGPQGHRRSARASPENTGGHRRDPRKVAVRIQASFSADTGDRQTTGPPQLVAPVAPPPV